MPIIYADSLQNIQSTYKEIMIDQGSTFLDTITLKNVDNTPFDLTNYSVRGQLRKSVSSSTATNFNCNVTDAANGVFTFALTAAQTAALVTQNYMPSIYVYDIEIYDTATQTTVYKVLKGRARIEPEVTR